MENILIFIEAQIYNLLGIFIGMFGICLAIVFYIKSIKIKEPYWAVRNSIIIEGFSNNINGLDIKYNNNIVEYLSIARIAFWNNGKETLDARDVATANPIKLVVSKGNNILDIKPIVANNPSSMFNVAIDPSSQSASISFDYLDQGQGAVFQIVHTGTTSKDIDIVGDIKGAKIHKRIRKRGYDTGNSTKTKHNIRHSTRSKMIIGMLLLLLAITMYIFIDELVVSGIKKTGAIPMVISMIVNIYMVMSFLWLEFNSRIPPSLSVFEDEPIL